MVLVVAVKIGKAVLFEQLFLVKKVLNRVIGKEVQAFFKAVPIHPLPASIKQAVYRLKKL
jgi:hypothetical protein